MSSFHRVRSKEELDKLIDEVMKNKKILTDKVTEDVVGAQFSQADTIKTQKPIIEGLDKITAKLDERLAPIVNDAQGNPVRDADGSIQRMDIFRQIAKIQDATGQSTAAIVTAIGNMQTQVMGGDPNDPNKPLSTLSDIVTEVADLTEKNKKLAKNLIEANKVRDAALNNKLDDLFGDTGSLTEKLSRIAALPVQAPQAPGAPAAPQEVALPQATIALLNNLVNTTTTLNTTLNTISRLPGLSQGMVDKLQNIVTSSASLDTKLDAISKLPGLSQSMIDKLQNVITSNDKLKATLDTIANLPGLKQEMIDKLRNIVTSTNSVAEKLDAVSNLPGLKQEMIDKLQQLVLKGSAGPQDLGGQSRQPPPSSGSTGTTSKTSTITNVHTLDELDDAQPPLEEEEKKNPFLGHVMKTKKEILDEESDIEGSTDDDDGYSSAPGSEEEDDDNEKRQKQRVEEEEEALDKLTSPNRLKNIPSKIQLNKTQPVTVMKRDEANKVFGELHNLVNSGTIDYSSIVGTIRKRASKLDDSNKTSILTVFDVKSNGDIGIDGNIDLDAMKNGDIVIRNKKTGDLIMNTKGGITSGLLKLLTETSGKPFNYLKKKDPTITKADSVTYGTIMGLSGIPDQSRKAIKYTSYIEPYIQDVDEMMKKMKKVLESDRNQEQNGPPPTPRTHMKQQMETYKKLQRRKSLGRIRETQQVLQQVLQKVVE